MYVETKRSLGFKFEAEIWIFKKMDKSIIDRNEKGPGFSKEFCDFWYEKSPNESERTYYSRCILLREFAGFLANIGIVTYCPRPPRYPRPTYVPYVFTHVEIEKLFNAADNIKTKYKKSENGMYCISFILRCLYATGLRIGELLNLNDDDIDFTNLTITVRDSKNCLQRIIPISSELKDLLLGYQGIRDKLLTGFNLPQRFFTNLNGGKLRRANIEIAFRLCLYKAGIHYMGPKIGPRLHCLRHTFACHSIASMNSEGLDTYVILPILATFLGHKQMDSINYYVRMTAEVFPTISKQLEESCANVYPMIRNLDGYGTN